MGDKTGREWPLRWLLRLVAEAALPLGAALYLIGTYATRQYYIHFGLTPSDVGLTQFDLMMITVGQLSLAVTEAAAALAIFGVLYGVYAAVHWFRTGMFLEDDEKAEQRRARRRAIRSILVVLALAILARVAFLASHTDGFAQATGDGLSPAQELASIPRARGARLMNARSDCMVLLGTNQGVWLLWDVEKQQLERHGVDTDVLVLCVPKPRTGALAP